MTDDVSWLDSGYRLGNHWIRLSIWGTTFGGLWNSETVSQVPCWPLCCVHAWYNARICSMLQGARCRRGSVLGITEKWLISGAFFYLWPNMVSANERRLYICKVSSHWVRPCSAIGRKQAQDDVVHNSLAGSFKIQTFVILIICINLMAKYKTEVSLVHS